MPIIGLTDKNAALPIIGVLRKGDEKKTKNAPGKDLTYFRFTSEDPEALQVFYDNYPDEPRQINVFLPHKNTDDNMDSWIEKWVAGGLVYRSDGENIVVWRNDKGHYSTESKPDPKPSIDDNGKRSDGSGHVGRLSIIVPELGRLATVTVLTTSKNDIINLTRQLRNYEMMTGDLRGIPFVLTRRRYKISTPGENGKRVRREKWLLAIETQPQWTMLQMKAMEQAALPDVQETALLPELISAEYSILPENPFFEETEEDKEEPSEPTPPKQSPPQTNGKPKSPPKKKQARNHTDDIYDEVQAQTNGYYNHKKHLYEVIGDWPAPDDEQGKQEAIQKGIAHWKEKEPIPF